MSGNGTNVSPGRFPCRVWCPAHAGLEDVHPGAEDSRPEPTHDHRPFGPLTVEMARKRAEELIGGVARGRTRLKKRLTSAVHQRSAISAISTLSGTRSGRRPATRTSRSSRPVFLCGRTARSTPSRERTWQGSTRQSGKPLPFRANRVVSLLRKMFNLARAWGLHTGENPGTGIRQFGIAPREVRQPSEMPALLYAIEMEQNPLRPRGVHADARHGAKARRGPRDEVGGTSTSARCSGIFRTQRQTARIPCRFLPRSRG